MTIKFLKRLKDEIDLPMVYVTHHVDEIEYLQGAMLRIEHGYIDYG